MAALSFACGYFARRLCILRRTTGGIKEPAGERKVSQPGPRLTENTESKSAGVRLFSDSTPQRFYRSDDARNRVRTVQLGEGVALG